MDADDTPLQAELDDCCQKATTDLKHAVLLLGVPADVEVARIEETTETIKVLGRELWIMKGRFLDFCSCYVSAKKWLILLAYL